MVAHMRQTGFSGSFPRTSWDLVEQAAHGADSKHRVNRLGELLGHYLSPLLTHLVLHQGIPRVQAEDLLQGFVTDRILTRDLLSRADRTRGKFRTFLLTALHNYIISEFRKSQSRRKSPGPHAILPLDALAEQVDVHATSAASEVFDLAWVREIIMETLHRVQRECLSTHRKRHWLLFEDRVVNPALHGTSPAPYAEMVAKLHFTSPIQAANAVYTVKRIFERTFQSVVKECSGQSNDIQHEIHELYAILSGVRA